MWKKTKPYIISIILALLVGALSAFFSGGTMDSYENLVKPNLSPPGYIFPIVWTILFILMGISSAIIYKKGGNNSEQALRIYILQLIVIFFWTIIFFRFNLYLFAFIWLVFLWILIILMIKEFKKISPFAAYLQIPYLLWVTFAGDLNLSIYLLNR